MKKREGYLLVEEKVNDFNKNERTYLSKNFQETEARTRFIDPFFTALGWELVQTNLNRKFWDVHREFSQRDDSSTKKPDYAFRVKENNSFIERFFVEAKAPWISLTDAKPVFQAKRYAFSSHGKAPIVILTDFQEFRVFNGLQRPRFDNPLQGLISGFDLKYTDYLEKWDIIWENFSKDAVYEGSINKLISKVSKSTKTLDDEFLSDIIEWRETLAKNIAIRNKRLSVDEINEVVQRILDRFVFIRNLEDRNIEEENLLFNLINHEDDNDNFYKDIVPIFRRLDVDYNGLLFKKHFSEELSVDNKVIKDIVKSMCYPLSPFQFDIIEPEILGRIYERFLGSKIRLTEDHRAKVEEKPEVRHAGGVYYTPEYIVKYIVDNTVGEKINGKTPEEIEKIRILDPACGSGSFLLGAFSALMEYHIKYYSKNKKTRKFKDDFFETPDGEIQLTLQRKCKILKNNIFGVDIDREATEVAIMSLYLKLLDEGFDKGQAMLFMKGHILPDMTANIKSGNSLVSTDFYQDKLFEEDLIKKTHPFDWKSEFSNVFKDGGFDIVIGNPPYIRVQELDYSFIDYCKKKYTVAWKRVDISILFIELANRVIKDDGLNGFITSNQFLSTEYGRKARLFLLENAKVYKMVDFGDLPIFQGALTYVSIFILGKGQTKNFSYYKILELQQDLDNTKPITIKADNLNEESWILQSDLKRNIIDKIKNFKSLSYYAKCWAGLFTGKDDILMFEEKNLKKLPFEKEILLPVIRAQDCSKFGFSQPSKYVIYPYKEEDNKTIILSEKELSQKYPKAYEYLKENKGKLVTRKDSRKEFSENKAWYALTRFGKYSIFHKQKIVSPGEVKGNKFALDESGAGFSCARVFAITTINEMIDLKALLGLLNSKLVEFYLHSIAPLKQGGYYSYSSKFIDSIPLPDKITDKDAKEIKELITYVDILLQNGKKVKILITDSDKDQLKRQNNFIEQKINNLIYDLYDITQEQIKIIENTLLQ
jgi:hypothetical protein